MDKILLLSPQISELRKHSARGRLRHLLETLARCYEVFFVVEQEHGGFAARDDEYASLLKGQGVQVLEAYRLNEILLKNRFRLALIEFFGTAERYLSLIRELQPDLNVVLDIGEARLFRETSADTVSERGRADRAKWRQLKICREVEAMFTVTSLDRDRLLGEDENLIVELIPNIHTIRFNPADIGRRRDNTILLVTDFDHSPNVDAVCHFCRDVMPLVEKERPDVRVIVMGDSPPAEVRDLASERVKILGNSAFEQYLRQAYISVAPLRYGDGLRGGIGEALARGIPTVASSIGVRGLQLTHGLDVLIGDTPEAFARCILDLMGDRELYLKLAHNGPEFIRRTCTPELVERKLLDFVATSFDCLRAKRIQRLSREQWDLNFDIFQRYKIAADAIECMRTGKGKVLDVGGRGDLLKFLPEDFVVTVDWVRHYHTRTSVVGSALELPFGDGAFDFVLAIDVVEHLPLNKRKAFVSELSRVAQEALVIGAPSDRSMVEESEALIAEFYKGLYMEENPWLWEHMLNGLPDMQEMAKHLKEEGFSVSILPNGYLPRWTLLLGIYSMLARVENSQEVLRRLSRFYNRNYYIGDNREPSYRGVLVAKRGGSAPTLDVLYPDRTANEAGFPESAREALEMLQSLEILHLFYENGIQLREAMTRLREKEREVAERDQVIEALLSKWPVRVYRKLKAIGRSLFPSSSETV
jgi:glycosyltransferase involved in cell wall biosynthesis